MKRRLISLLLALGLLCSLLPMALAEGEPAVTALCVTAPGQSVLLDEAEFEMLCRQATGHELESVTFSPLSPAVGKLTLSGEALTSDTVCHTRYAPRLSKVCFTPYARFTGQGEVAFTMTSEREETVSGVLILHVPEPSDAPEADVPVRTVIAPVGKSVDLCDRFPHPASQETATLTLTLPSSQDGYLWLDYDHTEVRRKLLPGETLYSDRAPNYHNLTFVPANGEENELRLEYVFSSGDIKKRPGALTLSLRENKEPVRPSPAAPEPDPLTVYTQTTPADLSAPLRKACQSRNLGTLKSVIFDNLPLPEEGTVLYQNTPVAAGESYPCDQDFFAPGSGYQHSHLSFVPGEGFQRSVTLRYVATDSIGYTYSGYLTLAPGYPSGIRFQDMAGWEWAMPAAEFLGESGYRSKEAAFSPGENATRMDLIHALALTAYSNLRWNMLPTPDLSDLPDDPELLKSVAAVTSRGVVQGNGSGLLLPNEPITRQDALVILHRAMVDRRKLLPSYGDLSAFSDADQLSPYAQEAVAILAAKGVVLGDGAGRLDPLSPITRAEMACLLYRAFG